MHANSRKRGGARAHALSRVLRARTESAFDQRWSGRETVGPPSAGSLARAHQGREGLYLSRLPSGLFVPQARGWEELYWYERSCERQFPSSFPVIARGQTCFHQELIYKLLGLASPCVFSTTGTPGSKGTPVDRGDTRVKGDTTVEGDTRVQGDTIPD